MPSARIDTASREDATFVETPYAAQAQHCADWLGSVLDAPLLVLEIGAGSG